MKAKKPPYKGFGFKQMLFAYLGVTKVLYWINTFAAIDSFGEFGIAEEIALGINVPIPDSDWVVDILRRGNEHD